MGVDVVSCGHGVNVSAAGEEQSGVGRGGEEVQEEVLEEEVFLVISGAEEHTYGVFLDHVGPLNAFKHGDEGGDPGAVSYDDQILNFGLIGWRLWQSQDSIRPTELTFELNRIQILRIGQEGSAETEPLFFVFMVLGLRNHNFKLFGFLLGPANEGIVNDGVESWLDSRNNLLLLDHVLRYLRFLVLSQFFVLKVVLRDV